MNPIFIYYIHASGLNAGFMAAWHFPSPHVSGLESMKAMATSCQAAVAAKGSQWMLQKDLAAESCYILLIGCVIICLRDRMGLGIYVYACISVYNVHMYIYIYLFMIMILYDVYFLRKIDTVACFISTHVSVVFHILMLSE